MTPNLSDMLQLVGDDTAVLRGFQADSKSVPKNP